MATLRIETGPYAPNQVRFIATLREDPDFTKGLSNELKTTEEKILNDLDEITNKCIEQVEPLKLLLGETGGDVDLSITILAHLVGESPSDLLATHSYELERKFKSNELSYEFVEKMVENAKLINGLSYLLSKDKETIINELNELANELRQEEDIFYESSLKITHKPTITATISKLKGVHVADLLIRHPNWRDSTTCEIYNPLELQPQPLAKVQARPTAVATVGEDY